MDNQDELFLSIENDDFERFIELLDGGYKFNSIYYFENIPNCYLCSSCMKGRTEMIKELLKRGVNPDGLCKEGGDSHCSLRLAISNRHINIIKILILGGADYNYKLKKSQIISRRGDYGIDDIITLESDMEKGLIDKEEITSFIGGLRIKKAKDYL